MSALEIVLLIAGVIIFILSFIIPAGKEENTGENRELVRKEMEKLVSQEMDGIKDHVNDVVDEAVEYAMEKTERSLERLSNEKIMAVNEYSDTVLQEIHKNHEEVMFLYDMLNDKHINLKNTVSQVNETVKAASETAREAEAAVSSFKQLNPGAVETETDKIIEPKEPEEKISDSVQDFINGPDISFTDGIETGREGINNNEKIRVLHKQGKSAVSIAKELGLGVGEVKLVINLYENL